MQQKKDRSAYSCDDRGLTIPFFRRLLWSWMVEYIPMSIGPNTITVWGQVAVVMAVFAALAAVSGLPGFYVVSALLLFTYLTFDNLDGPHARRTGRASPLGELLDHGLDGIASGAILLTAAISLRFDPVWMMLWLALGAVGFIVVFWEQYRTGHLIIPKMSTAEGICIIMGIQLLIFATGEPTWLRFKMEPPNAATGVIIFVLCFYAVAIFGPTWRCWRRSGHLAEILPALAIAGASCGYVAAGANPGPPCVMVSLWAADVVSRMIWMRLTGVDKPVVAHYQYLLLVPLAPALAGLWTPDAWALIAMILSIGMYGMTLYRAIMDLGHREESAESAHPQRH